MKKLSSVPSSSVGVDVLSIPPADQPQSPKHIEGRSILLQSQKAYKDLKSYVGRIELEGSAGFGSFTHSERRTFHVVYKRPGHIRLEGQDSNGDTYVILNNGNNAVLLNRRDNSRDSFASVRDVLYADCGASLGATVVLSDLLLDIKWNNENYDFPQGRSLLEAWATKAELAGDADVNGRPCQRVICERETMTWTIFVDKETHLIRRADYDVSPGQIDALKRYGGRYGRSGRIQSVHKSQVFHIESINTDVPDSTFSNEQ